MTTKRRTLGLAFGAALLIPFIVQAQSRPYKALNENARREKIMLWGSRPDEAACRSLQEGLTDPSADIRLRAASQLFWNCDRSTTEKPRSAHFARQSRWGMRMLERGCCSVMLNRR